jgi:hypothetical protein
MGIRAGTKLSDAHKKAIAAGLRRAVEKGWKPNGSTWPVALAAITPEARQRGADAAGRTMSGRPQRLDTVCGKHANHKNAKEWKFYNLALGKVLEGRNLNQLVRDNAELFDPKDLNWDTCGCNAVRCLRGLQNQKKKPTYSWKGWMIGTPNA